MEWVVKVMHKSGGGDYTVKSLDRFSSRAQAAKVVSSFKKSFIYRDQTTQTYRVYT